MKILSDMLESFVQAAGENHSIRTMEQQDARERAQLQRDRDQNFELKKRDMSLPCRRCKQLAAPIQDSGNRYRCSCGNQFAAARHNL